MYFTKKLIILLSILLCHFSWAQNLTVLSTDYSLDAYMEIPKNAKKLVVFIHGDGMMDADYSTPAEVKPFLEIAKSFHQKGIATLRYDKRAVKEYKEFGFNSDQFRSVYKKFTYELLLEDAVNIIRAGTANQSFNEVIILGHSRGVALAVDAKIALEQELSNIDLILLSGDYVNSKKAMLSAQVRRQFLRLFMQYDSNSDQMINFTEIDVLLNGSLPEENFNSLANQSHLLSPMEMQQLFQVDLATQLAPRIDKYHEELMNMSDDELTKINRYGLYEKSLLSHPGVMSQILDHTELFVDTKIYILHGAEDSNTPYVGNLDHMIEFSKNLKLNIEVNILEGFGHFLNPLNKDFSETYKLFNANAIEELVNKL
jgi:predicted esterase